MVDTTRISTKGQVVIPKRVREALGLKPGDPLLVGIKGDVIVMRKVTLNDLVAESLENHRRGKTLSHEETFKDLL
ncbi:AbrB/MazE/SpoVT family DNA-binding domain-containing protein [Candidatus Bipolaricaulota bacterium]|nr:AbrB/MazE/SpoVT family DNA-binding domain-containing protein [Candidatus Bipolaricaulota bacterium]